MKKIIKVEGMMCEHCVAHVKKALEAVEGVTAVDVDLKAGTATVEAADGTDCKKFKAAIEDAGYTVVCNGEKCGKA